MALLGLAIAGTLALGIGLIRQAHVGIWRSLLAGVLYAVAAALPVWLWAQA
jgi:hypothetical protein